MKKEGEIACHQIEKRIGRRWERKIKMAGKEKQQADVVLYFTYLKERVGCQTGVIQEGHTAHKSKSSFKMIIAFRTKSY